MEASRRTVCITRHGDRLDFADPSWSKTAPRPYDPPLSAAGRIQAGELGQRLVGEEIAHIFSSPFLRCIQTAQAVAEVLGLSFKIEPGLSEWLNREWFAAAPELLLPATVASDYPRVDASYHPRVTPVYPERGEEALLRSSRTAIGLTAEFRGNLLFVGHGASVLGATAGLLGKSPAEAGGQSLLPPIRCCCLVKLVRGERQPWLLELDGDVAHLSRTESQVRLA